MPARINRNSHRLGYREVIFNERDKKFYTDAPGDQFEQLSTQPATIEDIDAAKEYAIANSAGYFFQNSHYFSGGLSHATNPDVIAEADAEVLHTLIFSDETEGESGGYLQAGHSDEAGHDGHDGHSGHHHEVDEDQHDIGGVDAFTHGIQSVAAHVSVIEPDVDDTYRILKGLKSRFEDHYNLRYTDKALRTASELAARYINDRFMPDKAIDVIDEAGAAQQLQPPSRRKKSIGVTDVEQVVAKIARSPSSQVTASDKASLRDLDTNLKMAVFGQNEAIEQLATAIKLSRAGLKSGEKPIGSFLFAGPTGVGKTEVCKQLAHTMGVELLRYDMSEYMERHTVSRLIGAPPGYVGFDQGGLLTEAVTKHPHSIVLLDEIEKAHPEVFNLLLQVMDHGTLTDNNGRKADFRNVVLVMTTNAGAQEMNRASIGFAEQDNSTDGMEVIKRMFTPEFRNRLDAIVQFSALSIEVVKTVVDKFLTELQAQLDEKRVTLEVDEAAREWLAREGYDEKMGARPMQRLIQEKIKRQLAEDLLFGDLSSGGGIVRVSVADGELSVEVDSPVEA